MGETSQKMNVGLIRLDFQTRFLSKQLSRFLPGRSRSTIAFFVQYDSIYISSFSNFLGQFDTPKLPKVMFI